MRVSCVGAVGQGEGSGEDQRRHPIRASQNAAAEQSSQNRVGAHGEMPCNPTGTDTVAQLPTLQSVVQVQRLMVWRDAQIELMHASRGDARLFEV